MDFGDFQLDVTHPQWRITESGQGLFSCQDLFDKFGGPWLRFAKVQRHHQRVPLTTTAQKLHTECAHLLRLLS